MKTTLIHYNRENEGFFDYYASQQSQSSNAQTLERMKRMLMDVVMTELTPQQQFCVIEHVMLGKKQKEIASELGISRSTVSRHVSAGKRKLLRAAKHFGA